MPYIELKNITTAHGLKNVNLKVKDGEFMVILGPSGAGKSTLLNAIAGLLPYSGNILLDGKEIDMLTPSDRGVGYVFQELFLFPHMSVFENVAFSLQARREPEEKIRLRVAKILSFLGIEHIKDRYPTALSGGEKQRVTLARTLVVEPKILLMDEPLSSVDFAVAKQLRLEFKNLHRKLRLTTIYVTHNLNEAIEIADRIGVIVDGNIKQVDKADRIFTEPAEEIQRFITAPNVLYCDSYELIMPGLVRVHCQNIDFVIPFEGKSISKIAILPQDIDLLSEPPSESNINTHSGEIIDISKSGPFRHCRTKIGAHLIEVEIPKDVFKTKNIHVGKEVWLKFNMRKIKIIE